MMVVAGPGEGELAPALPADVAGESLSIAPAVAELNAPGGAADAACVPDALAAPDPAAVERVRAEAERILSRENIASGTDFFLHGLLMQLGSGGGEAAGAGGGAAAGVSPASPASPPSLAVPVSLLRQHPALASTPEAVLLEALQTSSVLSFDAAARAVTPALQPKRSTLILRELGGPGVARELADLLAQAPCLKNFDPSKVRPGEPESLVEAAAGGAAGESGDAAAEVAAASAAAGATGPPEGYITAASVVGERNWFLTLSSEALATELAWFLRTQSLAGQPIQVRVKSELGLRFSAAPPPGGHWPQSPPQAISLAQHRAYLHQQQRWQQRAAPRLPPTGPPRYRRPPGRPPYALAAGNGGGAAGDAAGAGGGGWRDSRGGGGAASRGGGGGRVAGPAAGVAGAASGGARGAAVFRGGRRDRGDLCRACQEARRGAPAGRCSCAGGAAAGGAPASPGSGGRGGLRGRGGARPAGRPAGGAAVAPRRAARKDPVVVVEHSEFPPLSAPEVSAPVSVGYAGVEFTQYSMRQIRAVCEGMPAAAAGGAGGGAGGAAVAGGSALAGGAATAADAAIAAAAAAAAAAGHGAAAIFEPAPRAHVWQFELLQRTAANFDSAGDEPSPGAGASDTPPSFSTETDVGPATDFISSGAVAACSTEPAVGGGASDMESPPVTAGAQAAGAVAAGSPMATPAAAGSAAAGAASTAAAGSAAGGAAVSGAGQGGSPASATSTLSSSQIARFWSAKTQQARRLAAQAPGSTVAARPGDAASPPLVAGPAAAASTAASSLEVAPPVEAPKPPLSPAAAPQPPSAARAHAAPQGVTAGDEARPAAATAVPATAAPPAASSVARVPPARPTAWGRGSRSGAAVVAAAVAASAAAAAAAATPEPAGSPAAQVPRPLGAETSSR